MSPQRLERVLYVCANRFTFDWFLNKGQKFKKLKRINSEIVIFFKDMFRKEEGGEKKEKSKQNKPKNGCLDLLETHCGTFLYQREQRQKCSICKGSSKTNKKTKDVLLVVISSLHFIQSHVGANSRLL